MAFDPLTLLSLKHGSRSVAVFREHCLRHEVSHANAYLVLSVLSYNLSDRTCLPLPNAPFRPCNMFLPTMSS